MKRFLVIATLALWPVAALAEPSYTIITKDGSTYVGELVEKIAGQHVTLKLASGEIKTIPLSDVRSERAETSITVDYDISPLPPLGYDGADAVHVHITKDKGTRARC